MQIGFLTSVMVVVFFLSIFFITAGYYVSDLNQNYNASIASNLSLSTQMNKTMQTMSSIAETANATSENPSGNAVGLTLYTGGINIIRTLPDIGNAGLSTIDAMGMEISRVLNVGWAFVILGFLFASLVVLSIVMMLLNRGQTP